MKLTYKATSLNELKTLHTQTQTVGFECVRTTDQPYPAGSNFSVTFADDMLDKFEIGQQVTLTIESLA